MAARNPLDGFERQQNVDSPARYAFAITPNDDAPDYATGVGLLEQSTRGIYIGTATGAAGTLKVRMSGFANNITNPHGDITFTGVVAGTILPIRVDKVYATGTDATDLIGLY